MASNVVLCLRALTRNMRVLRVNQLFQQDCNATRNASSQVHGQDDIRDPAPYFFDSTVQKLLLELNKDYSKVYEKRKEGQKIRDPEYRFVTDEGLQELFTKAERRARYYLQPPPVLLPRQEINEVLSKDPEIQGHDEDNSTYIFTDISFGLQDRERTILFREPDGTLRRAKWDERERISQVYYPVEGRNMDIPEMFNDENLQALLMASEFEFVLDRACYQFEPDNPKYIHVTSTVYNYIDQNLLYYALNGTRHFGSMTFYLIFNGKVDKFLEHAIASNRLSDAVTIIELYYIMNPRLRTSHPTDPEDIAFVMDYIQNNASDKKRLSDTLHSYEELKLSTESELKRQSKN